MTYDDVKIGDVLRVGDCKELIGDELTFAQLVREPGTSKLLLWMSATVGGELQDDSEFLVCQLEKVLDFDPEEDTDEGDEEWATVLFDIPGFSSKPVQLEYDDFEAPEIEDGDDPTAMHNMYHRIWRLKKALQPLERLALGAAIYSKCKANYIDSTEELLQAFESGEIRRLFSSPQITQIKTVLHNAHIDIPETQEAAPEKHEEKEEPKQEAAIVKAAPEPPSDPFTRAKALHQRIVNDAQAAAESVWDLCQAIKEMRDGKHYKFLLYDNFEGYCECELGMSRSHAYRYIQIAEGMSAENVASMRQIGTTKLALLASVTEEQREIISTAVDVESATVKELKAQIDELKGKVSEAEKKAMLASGRATEAEKARDNAQARYVKSDNQNLVLKDTIASKDKIIEGKNISMENLRVDNAQLKDRVRELESGRDHVLDELQAKIAELESRPVEVAVQDNSEELEQLRKEYEAKLKEAEADLAEAIEDGRYREINAMIRIARENVNTICMRINGLSPGKAKETIVKYAKEIGLLLKQLN